MAPSVARRPLPWIETCGNSDRTRGTKADAAASVQQEIVASRGHRASVSRGTRARAARISAIRLAVQTGSGSALGGATSNGQSGTPRLSSQSLPRACNHSISSSRKVGLQIDINVKSAAASRWRSVAKRQASRSLIPARVGGAANSGVIAAPASVPRYATSLARPIAMPLSVRRGCRVAGLTDQYQRPFRTPGQLLRRSNNQGKTARRNPSSPGSVYGINLGPPLLPPVSSRRTGDSVVNHGPSSRDRLSM